MNQFLTVDVRFFHATPRLSSIDIFLNDTLVAERLSYQENTNYFPIPKGNHLLRIVDSQSQEVLLNQRINVFDNRYITIIAIADTNQLGILSLPDKSVGMGDDWAKQPVVLVEEIVPVTNLPSNRLEKKRAVLSEPETPLRFVHVAPNAPAVDVYIDETPLFRDIIYRESTSYVDVVPVRYNLIIRSNQTNQELLRLNRFEVPANTVITVYLTGLVSGVPTLELVVLEDGVTA